MAFDKIEKEQHLCETDPGAYLQKACVSYLQLCDSAKCHVASVRVSCHTFLNETWYQALSKQTL